MNRHDIEAMCDVLDEAIEAADQLSFEEATDIAGALEQLAAKAKTLQGLLKTERIKALDGQPRKVGSTIYYAEDEGKWRPDQKRIRKVVAARASFDPDSDEDLPGVEAAGKAVDIMYDLFVAPRDMPKSSGLTKLGLEKSDVADWERTGTVIKTANVNGGPE